MNISLYETIDRLRKQIKTLEDKVVDLKRNYNILDNSRVKRNILFLGVLERERNYSELEDKVVEIINEDMDIIFDRNEIEYVRRVGDDVDFVRPISVTLTTMGKKLEILSKQSRLENTSYYLKDEYPQRIVRKWKINHLNQVKKEKGKKEENCTEKEQKREQNTVFRVEDEEISEYIESTAPSTSAKVRNKNVFKKIETNIFEYVPQRESQFFRSNGETTKIIEMEKNNGGVEEKFKCGCKRRPLAKATKKFASTRTIPNLQLDYGE